MDAVGADEWARWWTSGKGKYALPAMNELLGTDQVEELSGEGCLRRLQTQDLLRWATSEGSSAAIFESIARPVSDESDPIKEALDFLLRSLAFGYQERRVQLGVETMEAMGFGHPKLKHQRNTSLP